MFYVGVFPLFNTVRTGQTSQGLHSTCVKNLQCLVKGTEKNEWSLDNILAGRAYFRIQGKSSICPKRASYSGNISWFDSSTSMTIQSISDNWLKQVIGFSNTSLIYYSFLKFLTSSWRFWEYPMIVETEMFYSFYFQ